MLSGYERQNKLAPITGNNNSVLRCLPYYICIVQCALVDHSVRIVSRNKTFSRNKYDTSDLYNNNQRLYIISFKRSGNPPPPSPEMSLYGTGRGYKNHVKSTVSMV